MAIKFTERELDIMALLWGNGPSTVAEVRHTLAQEGLQLAYNTVLSMLRILKDKGYVAHVEDGRAHRYHALVERKTAGMSAIDRVVDKLFGGSTGLLATHLVSDRHLDPNELRALRRLLDERLGDGTSEDSVGGLGASFEEGT